MRQPSVSFHKRKSGLCYLDSSFVSAVINPPALCPHPALSLFALFLPVKNQLPDSPWSAPPPRLCAFALRKPWLSEKKPQCVVVKRSD